MIAPAPLLADADWGGVVIAVIVVVAFIARQIAALARKFQGKLPNAQQPMLPGGGRPPQKPGNVADSLRSEVEEFLRRAGQHPSQKSKDPQTVAADRRSRRAEAARSRKPSKPEVVTAKVAEPKAQDQGRLSERHLQSNQFEQREAHLSSIGEQQDSVAAHVHDVFDKSVVTMDADDRADDEGRHAAAAPTAAEGLLQMLRDPQSVRQALVLSEIFNRREF